MLFNKVKGKPFHRAITNLFADYGIMNKLFGFKDNQDRTVQIANAIRILIERPELASALAAQGRERAAQFSWDKTAQQTADVYRLALHSAGATTQQPAQIIEGRQ